MFTERKNCLRRGQISVQSLLSTTLLSTSQYAWWNFSITFLIRQKEFSTSLKVLQSRARGTNTYACECETSSYTLEELSKLKWWNRNQRANSAPTVNSTESIIFLSLPKFRLKNPSRWMCLGVNSTKPATQCCPLNPHKTGVHIKRTQLNFVRKICDLFEYQYYGVHSYQQSPQP